jgi:hypothetical protein
MTNGPPQLGDAGTLLNGERVTAIAPDGSGTVYAGDYNGRLRRFDPESSSQNLPRYKTASLGVITDSRYATIKTPDSMSGMAVRGTNLFVAGHNGVLTVFETPNATSGLPPIIHQIVHPASINAIDVTQDGSTIAVLTAQATFSCTTPISQIRVTPSFRFRIQRV